MCLGLILVLKDVRECMLTNFLSAKYRIKNW